MSKTESKQTISPSAKWAAGLLPTRRGGAHKWGVGGLVIVGGAPGYVGAPALVAMAAQRGGAGIVMAAVSRTSITPIATLCPEVVFLPMPEGDALLAARRTVDLIRERAEKATAFVVGPGLSEDQHANALMDCLFERTSKVKARSVGFGIAPSTAVAEARETRLLGNDRPAVIDADGLNWLSTSENWWDSLEPGSLVLTPHLGEMERLTGIAADTIAADPGSHASAAARKWKQVVLLKSNPAVVTDGVREFKLDNITPSLATAGTGDVLAGLVGAYLAQGLAPFDAACLAIYVGSIAAENIAERVGITGLVASDLPMAIAEASATLRKK